MNLKYTILASWKYCLSSWKRNWKLVDYPVVIRELKPNPIYDGTPRRECRYLASIVNWGLAAGGDSKEEAMQTLERIFVTAKSKRATVRKAAS
jgi:hypothetical protein